MKKGNNKGFFLSETIVVIAIVAVVLLGVFKIFSSVYSKYKESETYNTVNATNAVVSLKNYYQSIGFDYATLLGSEYYIELTDEDTFDSEYYDNLKETLNLNNVYLIDMTEVYEGTNINIFDVALRKYLKTLQNTDAIVALVSVTNGNEYGSVSVVAGDTPTLVGDADEEFVTIVPLNGTFTDPGYTNWDGDAPTTTWEEELDENTEGVYYLRYDFDGYLVRRKVIVVKLEYLYDYTGNVQTFVPTISGYYQLKAWGAEGGYAYTTTYPGGYGGYATGVVHLNANDMLYIYVGGKGTDDTVKNTAATPGGYNGGGNGYGYTDKYVGGGGGATHIATASGIISTLSANQSAILIVAGGGGGAGYESTSAYGRNGRGGGYIGVVAAGAGTYANSTGGTQTAGGGGYYTGSFGAGATCSVNGCSGGGGGLYGGGSGRYYGGAAGGSGYIANSLLLSYGSVTKQMYCYSCTTSAVESTLTYSTTNVSATPTEDYAKTGNGYATITYIGSD